MKPLNAPAQTKHRRIYEVVNELISRQPTGKLPTPLEDVQMTDIVAVGYRLNNVIDYLSQPEKKDAEVCNCITHSESTHYCKKYWGLKDREIEKKDAEVEKFDNLCEVWTRELVVGGADYYSCKHCGLDMGRDEVRVCAERLEKEKCPHGFWNRQVCKHCKKLPPYLKDYLEKTLDCIPEKKDAEVDDDINRKDGIYPNAYDQDCGHNCRTVQPYGFVPEADCPVHDKPLSLADKLQDYADKYIYDEDSGPYWNGLVKIVQKHLQDGGTIEL